MEPDKLAMGSRFPKPTLIWQDKLLPELKRDHHNRSTPMAHLGGLGISNGPGDGTL